MKVERNEYHVGRHTLVQLYHDHCMAALGHNTHVLLVFDAEFFGGIRIHFHKRGGAELVAIGNLASAGARVEMLHEAATVEPEWKLLIRLFVVVLETHGYKVSLAIRSGKFAVAV